ncbi:AraC family transcriptional regulator [Deinococcus maricopensis]|nr:helix-turn-helix domain-containing protein [Deinococcus maricopensis]
MLNGMPYRETPPHPALRGLVRTYWSVEEQHTPHTQDHHFMPERTVRLTFYSGDAHVGTPGADDLTRLPPTYVLGLHRTPLRVVSVGFMRALGVELYPWGAQQLLGWTDGDDPTLAPARDPTLTRLGAQVRALLTLGAWEDARGHVETWLLARARTNARAPGIGVQAATHLYASLGAARITDLADTANVSVRHLERQFRAEVGVTPKVLARLIRFEEAHNRLWQQPDVPLAALAVDLGFADQAHFTREFRAFAHATPARLAQHLRHLSTFHVHM